MKKVWGIGVTYWKILRFLVPLKAKLTGNRFFCNALTGNSQYNICINCDMTVSCNCQDYDGSGHIGDSSLDDLTAIFSGPVAKNFRRKLAQGKLPILTCTKCQELHLTSKDKAHYYENHFSLPRKGIRLENTVLCDLNCVSCARETVMNIRGKTSLSMEDIKKVSLLIKKYQIELLSFFNLGEPFVSPKILDQLTIIRSDNPNLYIIVSTNGVALNNDAKREAALLFDIIYFSIDGISDRIVTRYQRGGSFVNAYNNMKALVEYRNSKGLSNPVIEWKYVLFNWNDRKEVILQAIELAKQAGVDAISFWPTKSPRYGVSWRYYLSNFFRTLGHKSWKGREISFRQFSS